MESTAYATGKALYALQVAGLPASDAAYERAVQFLLEHAAGRRLVVRQDARHGVPAVLRRRLPPRLRPVDFRRGHQLGDDGAFPGISLADDDDDGGGIAKSLEAGNGPTPLPRALKSGISHLSALLAGTCDRFP